MRVAQSVSDRGATIQDSYGAMYAVHALARSSALLPSIMHDEDPRLMVELHSRRGRNRPHLISIKYSDADLAVLSG